MATGSEWFSAWVGQAATPWPIITRKTKIRKAGCENWSAVLSLLMFPGAVIPLVSDEMLNRPATKADLDAALKRQVLQITACCAVIRCYRSRWGDNVCTQRVT